MTAPEAAPMREYVTQADREAAIAYRLYTSSLPATDYRAARIRNTIGSGQWDDKESVQIFARHRLAHTARPDAGDEVEEAELAPIKPATPALREVIRLHIENVAGDEVERVARIIAPESWRTYDRFIDPDSQPKMQHFVMIYRGGLTTTAQWKKWWAEDAAPPYVDYHISEWRSSLRKAREIAAMREGVDRGRYHELERDFAAIRKDYGAAAYLIEQMRERWAAVSDQLDHIEGGMFAGLEDAASKMASICDDLRAALSRKGG